MYQLFHVTPHVNVFFPLGEHIAANHRTGTQAVAVRANKCGPNVPASAARMPMRIYKGGLFFT